METPTDNTAIIRMKREFDYFVSSNTHEKNLSKRLKFNDEPTTKDRAGQPSSISVKSLFDKEERDKKLMAELIGAQAQITQLESDLATAQKAVKVACLEKDSAISAMKAERQREQDQAAEMRVQMKVLADREKHARDDLAACELDKSCLKTDYEKRLASLQRNLRTAEDELLKVQEESWKKLAEMRKEKMKNETELNICQNELEETKAQLELQTKRTADVASQLHDSEEQRLKIVQLEQTIVELETKLSREEDDKVVVRIMKDQLDRFPEMETDLAKLKEENKMLKETVGNCLVLEERCHSLQQKLDRASAKVTTLHQLEAENEELKGRLQRWEAVDNSGSRRPQSPSELARRVAQLQETSALQLHQIGELKSQIHILRQEAAQKQADSERVKGQFEEMNKVIRQKDDFIRRLRQNIVVLTEENKSLQEMVKSLQSSSKGAGAGAGAGDAARQAEQSERLLAQYRSTISQLQGEVEGRDKQLREAWAKNTQMAAERGSNQSSSNSDEVRQLKERIAVLETSLIKTEEEKNVLEARIEQRHLQGDYDPSKVKVLSFSRNPFQLAKQQQAGELERLKEENRKLGERVKLLEESGGLLEDLTQRVEAKMQEPSTDACLQEVKEKLGREELRNKRLMEAFKKTSQEFRETCYLLTGYKIDIPCSNQYRLTSMYAESPGDYLLFKQSDSGEIQMLETDFSFTVQDLIESYLQKQDSIPAFLSSVTLELFSRQTLNMG